MATHATSAAHAPRKVQLPGYWRAAYAWRWDRPHPADKRDQQWFITAATTLKKLRESLLEEDIIPTESAAMGWMKNLVTWYWSWYSFHDKTRPEITEHPAVLKFEPQWGPAKGTRPIITAFLSWNEQYNQMVVTVAQQRVQLLGATLPNDMVIPDAISIVAGQYRGFNHTSKFAAPWEAS